MDYAAAVTLYRAGQPAEAVRRVRSWSDRTIARTLARVTSQGAWVLAGPEDTGQNGWAAAADAAALLHADAALAAALEGDPEQHGHQLRFALGLFEWRCSGLSRAPAGLEPAAFYAALASAELVVLQPELAARVAALGLGHAPADPRLLLVSATAHEELARLNAQFRRDQEAAAGLRQAERELNALLAKTPDVEAWLRLGRVLELEGRHVEAERPLGRVLEQATGTRERYLALLFLGEARERRGRDAEAGAAYRQALEILPDAQAALFGLARVQERTAGPAGGREPIRRSLAASRRAERSLDPWWTYRMGSLGLAPLARLRAQLGIR